VIEISMEQVIEDTDTLKKLTNNDGLLRLYGYWVEKCGTRKLPSRQDIDPLEFTYALSRVSLVDVEEGARRFHYRLVSTSLTERLGYEMTRRYVEDIPDEEVRSYVEALYARAADLRAPLYERSKRFFSNRIWNHEALVLPLSSDGSTIDMLIVYRITDKPEPLPRINRRGTL